MRGRVLVQDERDKFQAAAARARQGVDVMHALQELRPVNTCRRLMDRGLGNVPGGDGGRARRCWAAAPVREEWQGGRFDDSCDPCSLSSLRRLQSCHGSSCRLRLVDGNKTGGSERLSLAKKSAGRTLHRNGSGAGEAAESALPGGQGTVVATSRGASRYPRVCARCLS